MVEFQSELIAGVYVAIRITQTYAPLVVFHVGVHVYGSHIMTPRMCGASLYACMHGYMYSGLYMLHVS